jgi:hypothetical protein
MPIAVATSLATIVPTSISSFRAHHRRGAVDLDVARLWAPAIAVGAVLGSVLAARANARLLTGVFGAVAALMAIKMLLPLDGKALAPAVPRGFWGRSLPFAIGVVSSMMGIGGGTFSVPALTLLNQPVHRAVGTANLLGLATASPAHRLPVRATGRRRTGHPRLRESLSCCYSRRRPCLQRRWRAARAPARQTQVQRRVRPVPRWWPRGCCCVQ